MKQIVILVIGFVNLIFYSDNLKTQHTDKLENTRWEFVVVDNYIDYLEFNDSFGVTVFSCELDEKSFGKYSVKNDTVKVMTFSGEFDSEFPINSVHRHKKQKCIFFYNLIH